MRQFILTIGLFVVLASCGGEDNSASGGPVVVESPDGTASIEIDPASLPDGVSIGDVRLLAALSDSENEEVPIVAVQLEPHGTVLSEPAVVTMTVPGLFEGSIVTIHQSGNFIQFVDASIERSAADYGLILAEVASFSSLSVYEYGMDAALTLTPQPVVEGAPQTGIVTVTRSDKPVTILVATTARDDQSPNIRRYTLSAPRNSVFGEAEIHWGSDDFDRFGAFEPRHTLVKMSTTDSGWTGSEASVCVKAGEGWNTFFLGKASGDVELLAVGAPVDQSVADFATIFSPDVDVNRVRSVGSYGQWIDLESALVGDSITVKPYANAYVDVDCVPLDRTTETSSTTSPDGDDEGGLQELDRAPAYDCPEGHQPDTAWNAPTDGKGNLLEPESESARDKASDIGCTRQYWGSYVFVMTVKGDGESLSKQELTTYDVSFIVNNEWPDNYYYDDTGFAVYVSWQHLAQAYAWQVFDSDRSLVKGASVDIEWLDESTLQVTVDLPSDRVEVTEVRTELDVYISDADDKQVYRHRDVAIWTAEP